MIVGLEVIKGVFSIILSVLTVIGMVSCDEKVTDTYHTTDPSEYMEICGHYEDECYDIESGLFVFPKSIEGLENVEYEYLSEKYFLSGEDGMVLYLKATYPDAESYKNEVKRLGKISCDFKHNSGKRIVNKVKYSEKLFEYPAYITVYNSNGVFEYALVDDETRTIVCVFLQLTDGNDYLADEYLPIEFKDKVMTNYDYNWKNQNIYYAETLNDCYSFYNE